MAGVVAVRGSVGSRLVLCVVLAMAMVGALLAPPVAADVDMRRVAGGDRIATAVAVSAHGWDTSDAALVATAYAYPDALAAGALAAALDAPLLLTPPDDLPGEVSEELVRLGADDVYVLGGSAAVSSGVVRAIQDLPSSPSVERIGGENRWETGAMVAVEAGAPGGEAVVVSGEDFPDAVSAGALSATPAQPPVLLTQRDALPSQTVEALSELDVDDVTIVGGTAAVSRSVQDELSGAGFNVARLSGDGRFTTSVAVAEEAFGRFEGSSFPAVFATGGDFPDALSAGALAARLEGPLLLTPHDGSGDLLDTYLRSRSDQWSSGTTVGGGSAISDPGLERLRNAMEDGAPVEVEEGQRAAEEWFAAHGRGAWGSMQSASSGPAHLYADFLARLADLTHVTPGTGYEVITEATEARDMGDGRYRLDLDVEWDGLPLRDIEVQRHGDGSFTLDNFRVVDVWMSSYVRDGSSFGVDYGEFAVRLDRIFRNAGGPNSAVTMVVNVANRRAYPIYVDDALATLDTYADGWFYYATHYPEFPQIPPGQSRDIWLQWDWVAAADSAGWVGWMTYGPDDSDWGEMERYTTVEFDAWPVQGPAGATGEPLAIFGDD